jgi:hypothetical protein
MLNESCAGVVFFYSGCETAFAEKWTARAKMTGQGHLSVVSARPPLALKLTTHVLLVHVAPPLKKPDHKTTMGTGQPTS